MFTKSKPYKEILLPLLLGLLLCSMGIFTLIKRFQYIELNASDLYNDYSASKLLLSHQSIYSDLLNPNNHPPFVALLTIPLTLLPYRSACILWSILTIFLYFISGWLIYKELQLRIPKVFLLVLIGFALNWYPFQAHIALGQWSIQIGFCIILGWIFLRHQKDYVAGLLFGIACLIKLFPGLIILYLLFSKRWKALFTMFLTIVFGFIIAAFIIGPNDIILYFNSIVSRNSNDFMAFPINNSIIGILGKFFYTGGWVQPIFISPIPISFIAIILDIGLVIFLLGFLYRRSTNQYQWDIKFAMTIIVMVFVSPISWQHMLPMLMLPFGLIILRNQNKIFKYQYSLSLLALILFSLPDIQLANVLMDIFSPNRIPWYAAISLLSSDCGLVIIWILLYTLSKQELIPE